MCREKKSGTSHPLEIFDQVQICSGQDLMSNPSLERWTAFGADCIIEKQSASMSLVSTWTSLTSGRALLFLQGERSQLDMSRLTS